jgi:hypothetical protein
VEVNGYKIEPGADLRGAAFDKKTVWPHGFNREAAEMRFVD